MFNRIEQAFRQVIPSLKWLALVLRLVAAVALVTYLSVRAAPTPRTHALATGHEAEQSDAYATAIENYRIAYNYAPWDTETLVAIARTQHLAAEHAALLQTLDSLANQRPLNENERRWQAAAFLETGQENAAIAAYETLWQHGAMDEASLHFLAQHYLDQADYAKARRALTDLHAQDALTTDEQYRLALLLMLENPDAALPHLAAIREADPVRAAQLQPFFTAFDTRPVEPSEQWYLRLGRAYLHVDELALAELALMRATAINPIYADAIANLAYTRARLDEPSLAAAMQADALAPASANVQTLVGLTFMEVNAPYLARRHLERAYVRNPTNPGLAAQLASTYRAMNQNRAAEAWLNEAISLSGGDFQFRLLLAGFYVEEEFKVEEEALPLARELVEENPTSAPAHAILGWAYFLSSDLDRAFQHIDTARTLDPTLPRAWAYHGALLESQGRPQDALYSYTRALEFDPEGFFGAFASRAIERITRP